MLCVRAWMSTLINHRQPMSTHRLPFCLVVRVRRPPLMHAFSNTERLQQHVRHVALLSRIQTSSGGPGEGDGGCPRQAGSSRDCSPTRARASVSNDAPLFSRADDFCTLAAAGSSSSSIRVKGPLSFGDGCESSPCPPLAGMRLCFV
jgi:hypothetical protein